MAWQIEVYERHTPQQKWKQTCHDNRCILFFLGGGGAAFKGEAALYGLPSMLNHSTGSPVDIQIGSPDQSLEAMENSPPVFLSLSIGRFLYMMIYKARAVLQDFTATKENQVVST